MIRKWALHYSLFEGPEHHNPYFKFSEYDKLLIEAYKIKSYEQQTYKRFINDIRDIPIDYEDYKSNDETCQPFDFIEVILGSIDQRKQEFLSKHIGGKIVQSQIDSDIFEDSDE